VESDETNADDLIILNELIAALQKLDPERRQRVLGSVMTFLGIEGSGRGIRSSISSERSVSVSGGYSEDRALSPKEFMLEKQPRTDVERIACLAYYLTQYKDTPHFRTIDLSTLNTEAAQTKFSNAAFAVENATRLGYLVTATKGNKQISAVGEKFVRALPDRVAAKEVMVLARPRRKNRKPSSKQAVSN
jgi:hypothetical protein